MSASHISQPQPLLRKSQESTSRVVRKNKNIFLPTIGLLTQDHRPKERQDREKFWKNQNPICVFWKGYGLTSQAQTTAQWKASFLGARFAGESLQEMFPRGAAKKLTTGNLKTQGSGLQKPFQWSLGCDLCFSSLERSHQWVSYKYKQFSHKGK